MQPQGEGRRSAPRSAWKERAEHALRIFEDRAGRDEPATALAFATGARAALRGWDDSGVVDYIRQLLATRNPDGGFGLGWAYDAFNTGETNAPDTTYTVTTAAHVGRVLLEGAAHGAVDSVEVERLVEVVLAIPLVAGVWPGACIGYSTYERDAETCVHNVNASVALFLLRAAPLISRRDTAIDLALRLAQHEIASYRVDEGSWHYMGTAGRPNDMNHEAACIEAALAFAPPIGADAAQRFSARRDYTRWSDPLAQIRLLSSWQSDDRHLRAAFDAMVHHGEMTVPILAQCAYWAAMAAEAERIGSAAGAS